MNTTHDSLTDVLIARAAAYTPRQANPEALANAVAEQVRRHPAVYVRPSYVYLIRAVSGLAALWFAVFWAMQQGEEPVSRSEPQCRQASISPVVVSSGDDVSDYVGYLRRNVSDNKRLASLYSSFTLSN